MRQLLLLLLIPISLFSQQSEKWVKNIEIQDFPFGILKTQNSKYDYLENDFSLLIKPKTEFLGYIGSQFRQIKMEFVSVEKSINNSDTYEIKGFSIVGTNKCDFEGTLTIDQIREFENMHYGVDAEYRDSNIISQGILIGRYKYKENPEQSHVGIFEGIMTLWWYFDMDGKMKYDDIEKHSDSNKNNQYVGTWIEYEKSERKICNWGEYRIPFSGDLDIGAGEFSVNPKYYKYGWKNFK